MITVDSTANIYANLTALKAGATATFTPTATDLVQPGTDIFCRVSNPATASGNYRIAAHAVGFYV